MARPTDTRDRILATARELFLERGVRDTSLQHIADRLGITKPALYYHFSSRGDLLSTIVLPLFDELETFLAEQAEASPEELLPAYFDLVWRRRDTLVMVLSDLAVLHELDLVTRMLAFRNEPHHAAHGPGVLARRAGPRHGRGRRAVRHGRAVRPGALRAGQTGRRRGGAVLALRG